MEVRANGGMISATTLVPLSDGDDPRAAAGGADDLAADVARARTRRRSR